MEAASAIAEIGALFKGKRIEAGISEREVADYLGGLSLKTLHLYESGRKAIPLSHIFALSNCLNVSPRVISELVSKIWKSS
jgi:transcriptional regulator with XRE-family HTH domain